MSQSNSELSDLLLDTRKKEKKNSGEVNPKRQISFIYSILVSNRLYVSCRPELEHEPVLYIVQELMAARQ